MPPSNAPEPAPIPLSREFRAGAHQALLVSNGRDTFYAPEIQRVIAGPASPLTRFLPAATYTVAARTAGSTSGGARVAFALEADSPNARPLRSASSVQPGALALPRAEIDAFAQAVAQFQSATAALTGLQQQCRREFRLPDPVREPDAYWVIETGFERRLVILWGCERFARTSVPLDRVVQHLQACEMAWEDKQQLALQLAQRPDEPLACFIGVPARNGEGLVVRRETLPPKSIKPFAHFGRAAWQAFDVAARGFIARADDASITPFEAELRREFRLPSLVAAPARFHRHGAAVVIDASPLDRAKTVPPAPLADEAADAEPPLNQQLAKRVKFQGTPYVAAAGAAVVVALGALAFYIFGPDREPPKFIELRPAGPNAVALVFSEPMAAPATDAVAFVDDKRRIARAHLDSADPSHVIVETTDPLVDGEDYMLAISDRFTDRAGNKLLQTDGKFTFYDTVPPQLAVKTPISAGGMSNHDLVLTFTKPVAEESLSPSAFQIAAQSGGETGKRLTIAGAKFDPDMRDGTRVIVTADDSFQSRRQYVLSLRGVTDRAKRPNRVEVENRAFEYVDILPPGVRTIVGTGARYSVDVEFSKPLDAATALDEKNYTIQGPAPDRKPVRLVAGSARLDEAGRVLTLQLERSALLPGKYRLVIAAAADRQSNRLEQPIEREFEFSDAAQRGAPKIATIAADDSSPRITLDFDRGLAAGSITPEHFRILSSDRTASDLTVSEAAITAEDTRKVVLTLSRSPAAGTQYYVRTEALEDVFGTRQDQPDLKDFRPAGSGQVQTNLMLSKPPQLIGNTQVRIVFDNVIVAATARNPANYIVHPPGAPLQRVDYALEKDAAGRPSFCSVTLVFSTPFTGPVSVGASNLEIEGDASGGLFRVRPRRAESPAP